MLAEIARQVTDFGDSAILLPLSGLVFVALWLGGSRGTAVAWAWSVGLACLVMVALKIALTPCDQPLIAESLRNPSGHAAFSAVVYGGLALLLGRRTSSPLLRLLIAAIAILWVLAIGASRVLVFAHTPAEVVAGLLVGGLAVAMLAWLHLRQAVPHFSLPLIGLLVVLVLASVHGTKAPAEGMIRRLAWAIYDATGVCETVHAAAP